MNNTMKKTARITNPKFIPTKGRIRIKLEGSAKVGEMYIGIAGVRDPYTIKNIDKIIELAREQVREQYGDKGYELHFIVYGKNGVMQDLEPVKEIRAHELCVVVQGIAEDKEMAKEIALMGTRQIFYARLPEVKGTAGTAAFLVDEVLPATPAYRWSINHAVEINDPMELFDLRIIEVGG